MSVRVYPIRFSRKRWHIGLYCIHECAQSCNYILVWQKRSGKYILETINDDPHIANVQCDRKNNIEHTLISIKNFNIRTPMGMFGPLHEPDKIVIPNKEFYMSLEFPMSNKIRVFVNEPLGNGFMLKEILYAIQIAYEDIYAIEEQTSSEYQYIIMTNCEDCLHIDLKKCITDDLVHETVQSINDNCPICHDKLYPEYRDDDIESVDIEAVDIESVDIEAVDIEAVDIEAVDNGTVVQLKSCVHRFHENCIQTWINNDGKTCPVCRQHLRECPACNNEGSIMLYYEGVVPPVNYRGTLPRIRTDGIYGIYDYYLEDLYVNALKYDNEKNELIVCVQT